MRIFSVRERAKKRLYIDIAEDQSFLQFATVVTSVDSLKSDTFSMM